MNAERIKSRDAAVQGNMYKSGSKYTCEMVSGLMYLSQEIFSGVQSVLFELHFNSDTFCVKQNRTDRSY